MAICIQDVFIAIIIFYLSHLSQLTTALSVLRIFLSPLAHNDALMHILNRLLRMTIFKKYADNTEQLIAPLSRNQSTMKDNFIVILSTVPV